MSKFRPYSGAIMGLAVAIVVVIAALSTGSEKRLPQAGGQVAQAEKLSADAVVQCRKVLAIGKETGVIMQRPAPNRINVDETKWAALPADVKDNTLQAVACDIWETAMPAEMDYVVAYGYHSGKRLQMLTSVGMSRE